ncbi:hypothetical protein I3843_07G180500 [Carya illinoinensis]|nr:hypothetical protein I3843_07G180500 [Carya illinoinensis]
MAANVSSSSFSTGKSAQERGWSYVPDCYVVPAPQRQSTLHSEVAKVPVVDLAALRQGSARRPVIVNHDICQSVLDGSLSSGFDFFKLPTGEKMEFMSNDVRKPVRYATSLKKGIDKVQFWRVLLKHYAHPLKDWIDAWPANPPSYRPVYMYMISTYAYRMRNDDGEWGAVEQLQGALQVHLGDHVEVLSNGFYKSVVHRASLINRDRTRISIASLQSLGMDELMKPAKERVHEQQPNRYKESSFRDVLNSLSNNDIREGKSFINTLKMKSQ